MEKSWKIELSDGTKLENLGLNGNNFISETKITEDDFRGKLSHVIVKQGEKVIQELNHAELVQIVQGKEGHYFVLRELSEQEMNMIKIQGNIEYIAMMTDVDLEV